MSAVSSGSPQGSAPTLEPGASDEPGRSREPVSAASQADFGANEWLVEELYQKYLADPSSVDRAWWSFFADYTPARPNGTGPQPIITAVAQPTQAGSPAVQAPQPAPAPAPAPAPQPVPPPQPAPAPQATAAPQAAPAQQPVAAPPTATPPPPAAPGADVSRLRGAAARTVVNMTASLSVPTATSVRSVPAKLLVDNRIVINNHLRRGRGGKVSFTHLIGYAVVQALKALPEMNDAYTEENGKPAIAKPEHVNLGLAIDVQAADGSRALLVPNIKAAEDMDFRMFWQSYEDVVRRARTGKLAVEDFAGTTATLTNPGTIGTVHSVPMVPGLVRLIVVPAKSSTVSLPVRALRTTSS